MRRLIDALMLTGSLAACGDRTGQLTSPARSQPSAALALGLDISVTITDLGTLGGPEAAATGVNNLGHVVGWANEADLSFHAFLWTPEQGMRDLGDLGGGRSTALAVNDNDEVVGRSSTGSGDQHAFLWTAAGGMRDLGTLPDASLCVASDINSLGDIVGACGFVAFRWTASTGMEPLGELLPGFGSRAVAINDRGEIAGVADTLSAGLALPRAFLWTSQAGMQSLGTLDPSDPISGSAASDLNDAGTVLGNGVGTNVGGDFLWSAATGMRLLDVPHFTPIRMNNQGDMAGGSDGPALRLSDGTLVPLPPLPNDPGGEERPGPAVALSDEVSGVAWAVGGTPGATGRAGFPRGTRAVIWRVSLGPVTPPPTAEQRLEGLRGVVLVLVDAGALRTGEGVALTAKVDAAAHSLSGGMRLAAINQLGAFVNQVAVLERTGRLDAPDADGLLDRARAVIAAIEGTL